MIYEMKIDALDCASSLAGKSKVVTRAIWTLTGTDNDGNSASTSASTEFPAPEGDDFTPFDELTPDEVVSWVYTNADAKYLQSKKELIVKLIEDTLEPQVITPKLPWAVEEVSEEAVEGA